MKLGKDEKRSYDKHFVTKIPSLLPGLYSIKFFFDPEPSVPIIAKKFYEDVKKGVFPNVKLAGKKSSDGYLVV